MAALAAACSGGPPGPHPGSTVAGHACATAADCGCWVCDCVGINGPGAAQLCLGGHCPSGQDACATDCASAKAKVAKATPTDKCPATLQ